MEGKGSTSRRQWVASVASIALLYVVTSPSLDLASNQGRALQDTIATKPNMLLLVLDQWRYDWDGLTPNTPTGPLPLKMPFLEKAARKGVRFTQAYVPTPLCAPVRACLASGKEYDESGVQVNHGDDWPITQDTFYKLMRDQAGMSILSCGKDDLYKDDVNFPMLGYPSRTTDTAPIDLGFTMAVRSAGKTKVTKETAPFEPYRTLLEETEVGNDTISRAYDVYADCHEGPSPDGTWPTGNKCTADKFTSEIYPDDFVAKEALSLLYSRVRDRPFYMQVNFPGPHFPELSTAAMAASVTDREWPAPVDADPSELACPQKKGVNDNMPQFGGRCNYAAELENLDKLMGSIVDYLESDDALNNTIVCVIGDHGEMLGEHSMLGKKVPWQPSISVPMICFGPGIQEGFVYENPVTTLDLPGTFMDFAGVTPNGDMTTQSLRSVLTSGEKASREFISSGLDQWRVVIQMVDEISYKLICCQGPCQPAPSTATPPSGDGWHMLLYNTMEDRHDMSPVTDKPEIVESLRQKLPEGWCPNSQSANVHE